MANLRIVPRNFHDEATLSVEIAAPTGFAFANTANTQRSRVWRSATGAGQSVYGTFEDDITRTPNFFGLFRHRCHGGKVRLRLYSDVAWSTLVYDSTALDVVNVVPTDGADWGVDPYGDGAIDPHFLEAPYWLWFAATGCKSYTITFSNNDTTYGAAYWQVCRVWLGRYIECEYNPVYGAKLGYADLTDRNRTRGGSLRANIGERWRTLDVELAVIPEDQRAGWLDVQNRCGTGRDVVVSVFPGLATRRERDHILDATFSGLDPLGRRVGYLTQNLRFEEV